MTKWYVTARATSTLLPVQFGIETDMESLSMVLRLNRPATWKLVLRAESPFAQFFLPNSVDKGLKNGIVVSVDNEDGNGLQQVLAGPQLDLNPSLGQDNTRQLVASGNDNLYWLSKRRAYQVPHFPYGYLASSLAAFFPATFEPGWYSIAEYLNLLRFFAFNETSGTTATDYKNAQNGTYTGGCTVNQAGLLDDPNPSVTLDGTTGYISVPTAGLPAGNSSVSMMAWGYLTANPGSKATMGFLGTDTVAKQGMHFGVQSTGAPYISVSGVADVTCPVSVPLNTPFVVIMTWDGTTQRGYAYWNTSTSPGFFGSQTPGALSITYGTAAFGAARAGTLNFWPGKVQMGAIYSGALSAASIATLAAVGISRHAYLGYDTPGMQQASHLLLYFAQRNAGASGGLTGYGLASAATAVNPARAVPLLAIPTVDPALGTNLYNLARQDNLLDLLGALALASTPELGFKIVESSGAMTFSVFALRDQSGTAVFSLDRGNLLDYNWTYSAPVASHLIAGALNPTPGTPTGRAWGEGGVAASVSAWGYTEAFGDVRGTANPDGIATAINYDLAKDGNPQVNVNATLQDTTNLYFMGPGANGYQLGDIVEILVDGQTFKQPIREVQIDLQPGAVPVIRPAIGTPIDASILSEFDAMQKRLGKTENVVDVLSINY